jgi:hypothetical protein
LAFSPSSGVAARLARPTVAERYVNRSLADMGEYRGTVSRRELHPLAGGYVLPRRHHRRRSARFKRDAVRDDPARSISRLQWRAAVPSAERSASVVMHEPDARTSCKGRPNERAATRHGRQLAAGDPRPVAVSSSTSSKRATAS